MPSRIGYCRRPPRSASTPVLTRTGAPEASLASSSSVPVTGQRRSARSQAATTGVAGAGEPLVVLTGSVLLLAAQHPQVAAAQDLAAAEQDRDEAQTRDEAREVAQRLAAQISEIEGGAVPVGSLDVTMYRDDLRRGPARTLMHTEIPPEGVDDKVVVLVDDVLFSGRTVRAALDALGDLGRPKAVRLAVLVDRGHRELPIRADHVGKNLPTATSEHVRVRVAETDGSDEVRISGPAAPQQRKDAS